MTEHPLEQPAEKPAETPTSRPIRTPTSWPSPSADVGGLVAGAVFTVLGVLFILEAGDVWSFALSDLRYVAPLAIIVIGASVLLSGLRRTDEQASAA